MDSLTYVVEPDELAAAWNRHAPFVRRFIRRSRAIGALLLVGAALLAASTPGMAVAMAAAGAGGVLASPFIAQHQNAQLLRGSPTIRHPETVVVDESSVRIDSQLNGRWTAWSLVGAVEADRHGVAIIFDGGTRVQWIPARAFTDPSTQAAWVEQAQRWRRGEV